MLKLFNTLTRKTEEFKPLKDKKAWPERSQRVGLYTCGPTVYNYAHIGNLRTYVFEDILNRTLEYNGYKVKHIMNITDVGHLTSDGDVGEDKLEKGAKREHKTVWEIANFYTKKFKENILALNIWEPDIWCKATDHIKEQIKLVQTLIDKGYTYETSDGIYFDTTKISDYGKLANLKKQTLKAGARVEMGEKKNHNDFALWKWSPSVSLGQAKRQMEWLFDKAHDEKMGFPGWHIECSAMSMKYLGEQFDIHCGGIDHVSIHHTNEIAQSEAATGKIPWVKYWLHGEFLVMSNPLTNAQDKMSKSADNFITLETLRDKNFNPLSYRYFLLQAHYRKQLNFSWEALTAAQTGLERLYNEVIKIKENKTKITDKNISDKFLEAVNDDLDTPKALALIWEALKNKQINYKTLLKFDEILGLKLKEAKKTGNEKTFISEGVQKLLNERKTARKNKNWTESDRLRDEIAILGFKVEDTSEGQKITNL